MKYGWWAMALAGALALACAPADDEAQLGTDESAEKLEAGPPEIKPNGHGFLIRPDASRSTGKSGTGINYHGGPVMVGTKHVYFIWWGQWGSDTAQQILPDAVSGMSGSPWFNINSTYYDGNGNHVANALTVAGQINDTSLGANATITDSDVDAEVNKVLNQGLLPRDANAIYLVLTPADVANSSGFCTQWCGWHYFLNNGGPIKYAYIPNAARCPSACSAVSSGQAPNGNLGADAMVSILAHELAEAATDPQLNAWYDRRGYENADKCAWTFGSTTTDSTGTWNVTWGSRKFLVQRNWVNAGSGGCTLAWP